MTRVVLDASALLAMLLDEPGGEKVRQALTHSAISVVNLAEIVGHFARNGVADNQIRLVLDPLPVERVDFDEELAYATGQLIAKTRAAGLSFGDRACLALAHRLGTTALTADRAWQAIAETTGIEIELVR